MSGGVQRASKKKKIFQFEIWLIFSILPWKSLKFFSNLCLLLPPFLRLLYQSLGDMNAPNVKFWNLLRILEVRYIKLFLQLNFSRVRHPVWCSPHFRLSILSDMPFLPSGLYNFYLSLCQKSKIPSFWVSFSFFSTFLSEHQVSQEYLLHLFKIRIAF